MSNLNNESYNLKVGNASIGSGFDAFEVVEFVKKEGGFLI
jgi:hypothetical protein